MLESPGSHPCATFSNHVAGFLERISRLQNLGAAGGVEEGVLEIAFIKTNRNDLQHDTKCHHCILA